VIYVFNGGALSLYGYLPMFNNNQNNWCVDNVYTVNENNQITEFGFENIKVHCNGMWSYKGKLFFIVNAKCDTEDFERSYSGIYCLDKNGIYCCRTLLSDDINSYEVGIYNNANSNGLKKLLVSQNSNILTIDESSIKNGSFITSRIYANGILDNWDFISIKYNGILTADDQINVRYCVNDKWDKKIYRVLDVLDLNTITLTDCSNFGFDDIVDYELERVATGECSIILKAENNEVILENPILFEPNDLVWVRPFKKVVMNDKPDIDITEWQKNWIQFLLPEASSWIKLKVNLTGYSNLGIEEIIIGNKQHKPY